MHARPDVDRPWRARRSRLIAFGSALAGLITSHALAQLPPPTTDVSRVVTLDWDAPADCPARSYVMAELARQLTGSNVPPEKRIRARALVRRGEGQLWHLRLMTASGDEQEGDRTLEAETCHAAADATALIVAMAVDPSRASAAPIPAPIPPMPAGTIRAAPTGGEPSSAPAPSPPAAAPPVARATTPASAPSVPDARPTSGGPSRLARFGISAMVLADDGVLSGVSPGVGGALAWLPGRARLEVGGAFFPHDRLEVASNPARGARMDLATGYLRGCYAFVAIPVEIGPCAGAELGWLRAAGFGVASAVESGAMWEAITLGGIGSLPVGRVFSLRFSADAIAPLVRPNFVLAAPAGKGGLELNVHKTAALAGRISFGAELRF